MNPTTLAGCACLAALGGAVWLAGRLLYPRKSEPRTGMERFLTALAAATFAMGFAATAFSMFFILAILYLGATLLVLAYGWHRVRRARQSALLRLMATATRNSIPLGPAVYAFGIDERSGFGYQAMRLARGIEEGLPIDEALRESGRPLPPATEALLAVGAVSGNLQYALQIVETRDDRPDHADQLMSTLMYVACLLLFALTILSFVMIKIIPEFIKIFNDFDTDLPAMTLSLIAVSRAGGSILLLLLPVVLFLAAGTAVYILLRTFGIGPVELPILSRLTRRLDTAEVLRGIAIAAHGDKSLLPGIDMLAVRFPKRWVRRRLSRVAEGVRAGEVWWKCLLDERLIGPAESAVLAAATRVGNVPWAAQVAADNVERRFLYRAQAALELFTPALVVMLGLCTGFIVIALFIPLLSLIQKLT